MKYSTGIKICVVVVAPSESNKTVRKSHKPCQVYSDV